MSSALLAVFGAGFTAGVVAAVCYHRGVHSLKTIPQPIAALEDRLRAQAHSIEALQMTVSQTGELLENVLESLQKLPSDRQEASR